MYKRIILKLSGEALAGDKEGVMYDNETIFAVVDQIKEIHDMGTQVALVIGGGNIWRGRSSDSEMDRTKADQIGMLATVMNAVYVADAFRQRGLKAVVQTPIIIGTVTEQFSKETAVAHLEKGEIVIFAAGIGHPYFSTDTVTALRGAELDADILLFAKNVDGVYDSDPKTNPNAKKISEIKCEDIIRQGLRVIDTSAASLCYEQKIPVLIFGLNEENSLMRAVKGEKIGTVVTVG
ncbi:MAG: UMP kinase [Clostridia bacterium]|nr:UMP kinase [Clostridia bacterium]